MESTKTTEIPASSYEILSGIYPHLRRMAAARMASEAPGQTLQPTALVHEAWLRLSSSAELSWNDSSHFCAAAAETMRRILIDRARHRSRQKRWGSQRRVPMSEAADGVVDDDEKTLLVDEALERFRKVDPVKARLVLLKFFGGLTNKEIANEMSVTEKTVERYWIFAKAWLYREIRTKLQL